MCINYCVLSFFFFKQKTAYEMRISDWSSDVCSSDLWRPDAVPEKRPSEWPALFDLAIDILKHFNEANGFSPSWSFGGGTALMLQLDHRERHDIDLFLDDPQYLPFLNPETSSEESRKGKEGVSTCRSRWSPDQ